MRVNQLFDPAVKPAKAAMERHHLFPKAHLKMQGIDSAARANHIANMAFVEWPQNAAIADADPATYWPQFSAAPGGVGLRALGI